MEWTRQTVEALFDSVEENQHLEFKAGEFFRSDFTDNLTKFVTGFANADGGILLVGVKEGTREEKVYAVDFWPFDGQRWNREKIESLIDQHISPRILGVRIHPIRLDGDVGKSVYAIEVPKSDTCHQASDNRYYFRLDTSTRSMKDFQIRDVMNRKKSSHLELSLIVEREEYFNVGITNKGGIVCRNWSLTVIIPSGALDFARSIHGGPIISGEAYRGTRAVNLDLGKVLSKRSGELNGVECHVFEKNRLRLDRADAIFPRSRLSIFEMRVSRVDFNKLIVYWQIDSDDGKRTYGITTPDENETHEHNSLITEDTAYLKI